MDWVTPLIQLVSSIGGSMLGQSNQEYNAAKARDNARKLARKMAREFDVWFENEYYPQAYQNLLQSLTRGGIKHSGALEEGVTKLQTEKVRGHRDIISGASSDVIKAQLQQDFSRPASNPLIDLLKGEATMGVLGKPTAVGSLLDFLKGWLGGGSSTGIGVPGKMGLGSYNLDSSLTDLLNMKL